MKRGIHTGKKICAQLLIIAMLVGVIPHQMAPAEAREAQNSQLVADFADFTLPDKIRVNETVQIAMPQTMENESVVLLEASVTDSSLLDALVEKEESGAYHLTLKGLQTGHVALTLTVTTDTGSKELKSAVMIYDPDAIATNGYQYMILKRIQGADNGVSMTQFDSYLRVMPGSGEELRPGEQATDPWMYYAKEGEFLYYYDHYGSLIYDGVGKYASLKIRVPEGGIFSPKSHNMFYCQGGIMEVFLAPEDAENPMAPQYSLGTKDTYIPESEGVKTNVLSAMRAVKLEAGDYIVTWKIVGKSTEKQEVARIFLGGFLLDPINALPDIQLSAKNVPQIRENTESEIAVDVSMDDGSPANLTGAEISATTKDGFPMQIKTEYRNGKIYINAAAQQTGNAVISLHVKDVDGREASLDIPVTVIESVGIADVKIELEGNSTNTISVSASGGNNTYNIIPTLLGEDGNAITIESAKLQNATLLFESSNPEVATISEDGVLTAVSAGKTVISFTVTLKGITRSTTLEITINNGKTRSTFYTEERVAAARENVGKYGWASEMRDAAVAKANKYLGKEEWLWNLVTTQELPRAFCVGYRGDPEVDICRYCGCNIAAKYGTRYGWLRDPLDKEWKVQCPDCRRHFPSNDFGSFYQLGIDEHGNWSYKQAKEENAKIVANGGKGYLTNDLYPEKDKQLGITGWGVDDGYGYNTGRVYDMGNYQQPEVWTYIAFYNHWGVWLNGIQPGCIETALSSLRDAYIYTGEERYGRTGAILLDRVADVWPDMDTNPYGWFQTAQNNYIPQGKVVDYIWENELIEGHIKAYDAFYPMYDDPYVVNFLSEKAEKYQMENTKDAPQKIRKNAEDNLLREAFRAAKDGKINGNFGMTQSVIAYAAVVLDTMPETKEMLDWNFQAGGGVGEWPYRLVTGGNINPQLIDKVNRDGVASGEIAPNYAAIWTSGVVDIMDALDGYEGYPEVNLYNNVKFRKMLSCFLPITLCRRTTPQIGDSGGVGKDELMFSGSQSVKVFKATKDPIYAQQAYAFYKGKLTGVHYDIFTKNPETAADEIRAAIEQYGEYDFDRSQQLGGYGFTVLRSGSVYQNQTGGTLDTQRDFWMYYGGSASHGHYDGLNLGMEAYGMNFMPELAYPQDTTSDNYFNWGQGTIAHNLVMVDNARQNYNPSYVDKPLHYDGDGIVKVMDVAGDKRYSNASIYRRSVVMIDVDDEVSYGVDFFRVKGGSDHIYNFHCMSDEIVETEGGLDFVAQTDYEGNYVGTYGGPTMPFGKAGQSNGYSWLDQVDRAQGPENGEFAVDYQIKDFRNQFDTNPDLHLRVTMLNDFAISEVATANGYPAKHSKNPEKLRFLLVKRAGANLDSLFTTVLEPYQSERYVEKIEKVSNVTLKDGGTPATNTIKAIKVTLKNGRTDYIVYCTDDTNTYRIDDLFDFQGFVGVYMLNNGKNVYSYINDGTVIGDATAKNAFTGTVTDFTRELSMENTIALSFDQDITEQELQNQWIYVDNGLHQNAAYPIKEVLSIDGRNAVVSVGDLTFIAKLVDSSDESKGYDYYVAKGNTFKIPLSHDTDTPPNISDSLEKRGEAGSLLQWIVAAEGVDGKELTYKAKDLPRGAQFDPITHEFRWIPDAAQVGTHHISFEISNGDMTTTIHYTVKIYHSTSAGGSGSITNPPQGGSSNGGNGGNNGNKPNNGGEGNLPPKPTVEKDKITFAASPAETTAENKLGSITFPDGTFAKGGQGTLTIERKDDAFVISVTADVEQNETLAKVSLNYAPASSMTDENCIIVKDGNGNIIPSSRYADGKVTFYTENFGEFTVEYNAKSFTDLGNYAWASDAITRLAARGIINGITTTTYGPGNNITRADFTTLIVRAFGFKGEVASFADVPANAYYAESIGIAKTLGIVNGVNASDFAPLSEITRQDMMVIIARALDVAGYTLESNTNVTFADSAQVADYAKDAFTKLTGAGLIAGSNGLINPFGKATRAEVAVLLDRIVFSNKF